MHVIIKTERHPDRAIDEVFGPYADDFAAHAAAEDMDKAPENFNGNVRLFNHFVYDLTAPKA